MSAFTLESKRADETDADYEARSEAYWRQLEQQVDRVRELRAIHTNKVKQPVKRRTV